METNNLFKTYTKSALPALQVYVPQLFGLPGVSVREVRHGKGQAHKYCRPAHTGHLQLCAEMPGRCQR